MKQLRKIHRTVDAQHRTAADVTVSKYRLNIVEHLVDEESATPPEELVELN